MRLHFIYCPALSGTGAVPLAASLTPTGAAPPMPSGAAPAGPAVARSTPGRWTDAGYATAEAAVVLPSLLVALAMAVWVLSCVGAQLRCVDAARTAARAAARGETFDASAAAGRRLAPTGADVQVRRDDRQVRVDVSVSLRPFGQALRLLPAVHVSSSASAEREDVPPQAPR